jgi:hypothetical protein
MESTAILRSFHLFDNLGFAARCHLFPYSFAFQSFNIQYHLIFCSISKRNLSSSKLFLSSQQNKLHELVHYRSTCWHILEFYCRAHSKYFTHRFHSFDIHLADPSLKYFTYTLRYLRALVPTSNKLFNENWVADL